MNHKNKTRIMEVIPSKRAVTLENLYLDQNIQRESELVGRPILYANYICDLDDVIAVKDENGIFQVPKALKNSDDWRLFQELEAQADVIITSRAYLNRFAYHAEKAQDILTQFEAGGEFDDLGAWRLKNGFASRSPDIAIVGRGPDIIIPESIFQPTRKIMYFTTYDLTNSAEAKKLEDLGIIVAGAGIDGVEGKVMIDDLAARDYRTICMISGPSIFSILLDAGMLDRLYLTRVFRRISADDPSSVVKIRYQDKKVTQLRDFILVKRYLQERVITEDEAITSQEFSVFERFEGKR